MSPKIKLCKEKNCSNQQTTRGYCRLHYLKNWKKIKEDEKKKAAKDLNRYVENIVKRNPDKSAEAVRQELAGGDFDFEARRKGSDELDDVISDLGYKSDLDYIFDNIKLDDSF